MDEDNTNSQTQQSSTATEGQKPAPEIQQAQPSQEGAPPFSKVDETNHADNSIELGETASPPQVNTSGSQFSQIDESSHPGNTLEKTAKV